MIKSRRERLRTIAVALPLTVLSLIAVNACSGAAEDDPAGASGPLVGVASPAAVLICEADDAAAVENALADDPFRAEDLLDRADITEWNPVLGVFAS